MDDGAVREAVAEGTVEGGSNPSPASLPTVLLGVPNTGSVAVGTMFSTGIPTLGKLDVKISTQGSSLLCFNFNGLWATALNLNPRPKYFAMHHADIAAPPGWLDELIEILEGESATLVSAVVPIKDFHGLTSTAVLDLETASRRRLTVREAMGLPDVFDAKMAAGALGVEKPERSALLVNTGLFVCRFAGEPWIEKFCFHTGDQIRLDSEGYRAHVFPEDWLMSAELAALGLKVIATHRIPVQHFGTAPFGMGGPGKPWGDLEKDAWQAT